MTSSLPDERDLRRRYLSFQPFTYGHIWLWALLGIGLPVLAIVSVLGLVNGWSPPWPGLALGLPVIAVALNGAARSVWLRRLPRNTAASITEP